MKIQNIKNARLVYKIPIRLHCPMIVTCSQRIYGKNQTAETYVRKSGNRVKVLRKFINKFCETVFSISSENFMVTITFQNPLADAWILPIIQGFVQIESCKVDIGFDFVGDSCSFAPKYEVSNIDWLKYKLFCNSLFSYVFCRYEF